ncbi:hypothetical protein OXX69_003228 [Metschnikowia pulcherrima]
MSGPPLGTLIIEDVETLGANAVLGIDTQFFTVQNFLKGIKLIPAGYHLLHYSSSVDDGVSMRYAWWFSIDAGGVLSVKWADEEAKFRTVDASDSSFGNIYQYMVSYPENTEKWSILSSHIDSEALEEYLPTSTQAITTATPSAEENMVLLDVLKSKKSDISVTDQSHDELKYTIIEPHKKRGDAVGEQLTKDLQDRSWYLEELFGHDVELLLAEIQISFVHFVVLCNLCSCTQWMSLLALVSKSKHYLRSNHVFSQALFRILKLQLETLPEDYVMDASGMQVVDRIQLKAILSEFHEVFEKDESWVAIIGITQRKFGIGPSLQSTFDESHFEKYDLSAHNEDDEDAPAIVF